MNERDELERKLKDGGKAVGDFKSQVSDAAIDVARSASKAASDTVDDVSQTASSIGQRVATKIEDGRERLSEAADEMSGQASRAYGRATDVVRSGYDTAAGQVAASPMSSLTIAAVVGLGIGWALRGQHEADKRNAWMNNLPDYIRRRIG